MRRFDSSPYSGVALTQVPTRNISIGNVELVTANSDEVGAAVTLRPVDRLKPAVMPLA